MHSTLLHWYRPSYALLRSVCFCVSCARGRETDGQILHVLGFHNPRHSEMWWRDAALAISCELAVRFENARRYAVETRVTNMRLEDFISDGMEVHPNSFFASLISLLTIFSVFEAMRIAEQRGLEEPTLSLAPLLFYGLGAPKYSRMMFVNRVQTLLSTELESHVRKEAIRLTCEVSARPRFAVLQAG